MSYVSSSSCKVWKYDVFLSFRGEDTRRTIVSHLCDALKTKGILVFKDDERLETGKSISDELLKAIEESRSAIVIFSKSYASSKWCLEELAHIIKCRNELELIVIPIFYDVSPSEVRHQDPPFAESFSQHEEKLKDEIEKVHRWRSAFAETGKIVGHDLKNYKDEAECIKEVVDYIFPKSLQVISPFSESLVGIESQIEKVMSLIDMESDDARFIGIWGMSGIGKTEIASVIYERYCHRFEANCFLGNVREMYQKKGVTWLQKSLIRELLGKKMTITSEHQGARIIRNGLRWKKVLVILDDVNNLNQLELVVGGPEWFGRGSRILITTKDKHLIITCVKEADKVYEVLLLSENDALELFCIHAFKRRFPERDFEDLSSEVVKYADGLPLALKVLGSSFYRRNKEQWRDIIDRLKKIPNDDILGKLKISLDGLNKHEMRIFLDIACLYNSYSRNYVERVLQSCGINLIGISYLIEKSLISINNMDYFVMHNLIREMGENVSREEYTNSRIWLPEKVGDLFAGKLEAEKVESLKTSRSYYFKDEIFKKMHRLQALIITKDEFVNSTITCLPSSLRWIDWRFYPSSSLPESFEPLHLVGLSLEASSLIKLCPLSKKFSNLKYLDLSESLGLAETPDFGDIPNLKILDLGECENLEKVHPSLGHCRMLTSLNFTGCRKLKKLPEFVPLESLEILRLLRCVSLEKFPNIGGDMLSLASLSVGSPWIRSLPLSLSGLSYLDLNHCEDLESIPDTFQYLEILWITSCNKISMLPNSIFESERLKKLHISQCSRLLELPQSLEVQKKLEELFIRDCENFKKLPNSIQMESLEVLDISHCPKLDRFPEINGDNHGLSDLCLEYTGIRELPLSIENLSALAILRLDGCEDLVSLPNSMCNLKNLQTLHLCGCKKLEKLPENIGDLQQLVLIDAGKTAIYQPTLLSITKLGKLEILKFSHEQQLQHSSSFVFHQLSALSSLKHLELGNCDILGGLPEELGSLHSLESLRVSGRNISCLPSSINKLLSLRSLNVQFCLNLNEFPKELPPNLVKLYADYNLALKSIRGLVMQCVMLENISLSWHGHEKLECKTVSTNHFIQQFLRTCIQNDFHERRYYSISFPEVRIPETFGYQFTNQRKISIDLISSWYTEKFMGFSICFLVDAFQLGIQASLICESDPERKYSLKYSVHACCNDSLVMNFIFIPFKTWWRTLENKEGKNPNDYCRLEVSIVSATEACWGIQLEYEKPLSLQAKGSPKREKLGLIIS